MPVLLLRQRGGNQVIAHRDGRRWNGHCRIVRNTAAFLNF